MQVIVGGVIEEDEKILMVQEAKKKCYQKWNIPAGHLEEGEAICDGAIREILEETGYQVELTNMLPIFNKTTEDDTYVFIIFTANILKKVGDYRPEEILDLKWISKVELEKMDDTVLRNEKMMKMTLEALKENKLYPFDTIQMV